MNDTLSLTNTSAIITGGSGCKLDVPQTVKLNFMPAPGETGVYQAMGTLEVQVGADTQNDTSRGTYYSCALSAVFSGPMTVTDTNACGVVKQTLSAIPFSFEWYRE